MNHGIPWEYYTQVGQDYSPIIVTNIHPTILGRTGNITIHAVKNLTLSFDESSVFLILKQPYRIVSYEVYQFSKQILLLAWFLGNSL